jgi:hypothetical protein
MAKSDTESKEKDVSRSAAKEKKEESPIAIAAEALNAKIDLPEQINIIPTSPEEATRAVDDLLVQDIFEKIKFNRLKGALARSESFANTEIRNLEESAKKTQSAIPSPPSVMNMNPQNNSIPIGLGTGIIPPINSDRAASLKVALDSFTSDDARRKFIDEHPEYFSSVPINPGVPIPQQRFSSQNQPQMQQDPTTILADATKILMDHLKAGMDIQKAISPPAGINSGAPSTVEVVNTFKDINASTVTGFTNLVKDFQSQMKTVVDDLKSSNLELQKNVSKLQMDLIEKDKEYMKNRIDHLESALQRPPEFNISQLRSVINEANANGVPVSVDTEERERLRSDNARKDREQDHKFNMEQKKIDLELHREKRRGLVMNSAVKAAGGFLEGTVLKKHVLSTDGESVARRF